jgi:hypothetical protein
LVLLNGDNIFNGSLDVKLFQNFYELASFQLSEPEYVLDVEQKQRAGRGLYLIALEQLLVDVLHLLVNQWLKQFSEIVHDVFELQSYNLEYLALVNYGVQRVSHLVTDR